MSISKVTVGVVNFGCNALWLFTHMSVVITKPNSHIEKNRQKKATPIFMKWPQSQEKCYLCETVNALASMRPSLQAIANFASCMVYLSHSILLQEATSGGGGIRTHETRHTPAGFKDRCIRPLCHASKIAGLDYFPDPLCFLTVSLYKFHCNYRALTV
jgi:hypothetical protein